MTRRSVLLSLALLISAARPAFADPIILFSTFGPGGSYDARGGTPILGPGFSHSEELVTPGQWMASSFSLNRPARLTGIDLALGVFHRFDTPLVPVDMTLQLVRDDAGLPGNAVLDTLSVTAVAPIAASSVHRVNSITQPLLSAGMYWFVASTTVESATVLWMASHATGFSGAQRVVGDDWGPPFPGGGAFQIRGEPVEAPAPVPEPATLLLVATGIGVALQRMHRNLSE